MDSTLYLTPVRWIELLELAERLLSSNYFQSRESRIPFEAWQNELGRLRTWGENVDVYQTRETPLDQRLDNVPHVRDQIVGLLSRIRQLLRGLEEESYIRRGTELESEPGTGEPETILQDMHNNLQDCITGLYQVSVLVPGTPDDSFSDTELFGEPGKDRLGSIDSQKSRMGTTEPDQEPFEQSYGGPSTASTASVVSSQQRANERPVISTPWHTTYMWICCHCGDGPKVYNHTVRCLECSHRSCPHCSLVKD